MNRKLLIISLAMFFVLIFTACAGEPGSTGQSGPQGPAGPAGPAGSDGAAGSAGSDAEVMATDLSCTECHDDTSLITGSFLACD